MFVFLPIYMLKLIAPTPSLKVGPLGGNYIMQIDGGLINLIRRWKRWSCPPFSLSKKNEENLDIYKERRGPRLYICCCFCCCRPIGIRYMVLVPLSQVIWMHKAISERFLLVYREVASLCASATPFWPSQLW